MTPIPDFAPQLIPFDVQGGNVESWSRYLPCEANTATFKTKILQSHTDPQWNSQIRISLSNDPTIDRKFENFDEKKLDASVAVTLVSDVNGLAHSKSFSVIEAHQKGKKGFPFLRFPTSVQNNQEYLVVLHWGSKGEVSASINGGPALMLNMGKRVTTLSLFASGVKVEVRDLQIGRIGPKPKGNEACAIS